MSETTPCVKRAKQWLLLLLSWPALAGPAPILASAREEAASFLEIPLGGRPTAMGGAYSALADDAYAVNLNPGGLGFLKASQFTGQHLSYFESGHFDHIAFGKRLSPAAACGPSEPCPGSSLGGSVQYLGGGDFAGTDADGAPSENFSTRYAVYNLSFGRAFTRRLSFGLTGKWIHAKIADVSAAAFAADVGSMVQVTKDLTFAAVLRNAGSELTFLEEGAPLPTALHAGLAYRRADRWTLSVEGVRRKQGAASAHLGLEVRPLLKTAFRVSYRTDAADPSDPLAGLAAGFGVQHQGMDFSYAWKPAADLGVTHYFSFSYAFEKKNGGR